MHAEASSACTVMGTGVGKATLGAGVERVAVLITGGHGRRTAPVALARCRVPSLNRSSSAPKSLCAACLQTHMTPHRVLVVQTRRPLRVAMGHTSDTVRSRTSASLAPKPVSGRQNASVVGTGGLDRHAHVRPIARAAPLGRGCGAAASSLNKEWRDVHNAPRAGPRLLELVAGSAISTTLHALGRGSSSSSPAPLSYRVRLTGFVPRAVPEEERELERDRRLSV